MPDQESHLVWPESPNPQQLRCHQCGEPANKVCYFLAGPNPYPKPDSAPVLGAEWTHEDGTVHIVKYGEPPE